MSCYRISMQLHRIPKRRSRGNEACLQTALAGAGGLHVGLVTFLLADPALHHDTALGPAHGQLNIFSNDVGIRLVVVAVRRGRHRGGGGSERRLRDQVARHQREVIRHPRAASSETSGDRINTKLLWSACRGGAIAATL